ncbi:unnamed protein product [Trichobilharzia szidati]|nr:unnamed protein product [Trichobilharzia szidati]
MPRPRKGRSVSKSDRKVAPEHRSNSLAACEMRKTSSQVDYDLKDASNNAIRYSLSLRNRKVVGQLTPIYSSNPSRLSPYNPSDEHRRDCQQYQFQCPGSGKKSSAYTKRLSRQFRHENMILNRSYTVAPEHRSNSLAACEMRKTSSQVDYDLKDASNNAIRYSLSLRNRKVVGQLTSIYSSNPSRLSPYNPSDEHRRDCQQYQFQCPGSGKKSSAYTKRLSRQFRHENMILNRSYTELLEAGDAKGALLKICEQTDYKTFSQLFAPAELTALGMGFTNCTSGFVELIRVHLVQGPFPLYLRKSWEEYDRLKGSENDHPNDRLVYVDLSGDPTLFQSQGDYQFDIYRRMKSHNQNDWSKFSPKTNVMWLHYLTTKLCCDLHELASSPASACKRHAICCKHLKDLELSTRKFRYKSSFDLVTTHKLFKNCREFFSDK